MTKIITKPVYDFNGYIKSIRYDIISFHCGYMLNDSKHTWELPSNLKDLEDKTSAVYYCCIDKIHGITAGNNKETKFVTGTGEKWNEIIIFILENFNDYEDKTLLIEAAVL